jgi:hypothetical protein
MAEIDVTEIVASLSAQAVNMRNQLQVLDAQRAQLLASAEKYERVVEILKGGSERSVGVPDFAVNGAGQEMPPVRYRPTRDAIRDLLREQVGTVLSVKELENGIRLRGWLDTSITAPTEAVRYAAKRLAATDPNVERVGTTTFRWVREPLWMAADIEAP